jgi:hypothetical protein
MNLTVTSQTQQGALVTKELMEKKGQVQYKIYSNTLISHSET